MKRLFIGIFAISIALVSCNKETVVPSANYFDKILVKSGYEGYGYVGNLYETKGGQLVFEVDDSKEPMTKYLPIKPFFDGFIYNNMWGQTRCLTGGENCTNTADNVIIYKPKE